MISAATITHLQMQLITLAAHRDKLSRECSGWLTSEESESGCNNIVEQLTRFIDVVAIRLLDRVADGDEAAAARLNAAILKLQGFTQETIEEQNAEFTENMKATMQGIIEDVEVAAKGIVASAGIGAGVYIVGVLVILYLATQKSS